MVVMFNQLVHFNMSCIQIRLLFKPPGGGYVLKLLFTNTNDTGTALRAGHPVDPFAVTRSGDICGRCTKTKAPRAILSGRFEL